MHVTFKTHDGRANTVPCDEGKSLLQTTLEHGVEGLLGDCGGCCSCATCHVAIDPAWHAVLPPISEMEEEMLGCTAEPRTAGSRLACQIVLRPDMNGMLVHLPARQG